VTTVLGVIGCCLLCSLLVALAVGTFIRKAGENADHWDWWT
jgi:hypothetical protein